MQVSGYQVLGLLWEGPESVLLRARRNRDRRPVILRLLTPERPAPARLAEFRRQFALLISARCEAVAPVLALEPHGQSLVMVLDDVGGEVLGQRLRLQRSQLEEALQIGLGAARALESIRRAGLARVELRAEDLLWEPGTESARIIGLGPATRLQGEASGSEAADCAVLGDMLQRLFGDGRARAVPASAAALPPVLDALVDKLLARGGEGYRSLTSATADLGRCLAQWRARGDIERFELDACPFPSDATPAPEAAPASLAARLAGLTGAAQRVLALASCLGKEFRHEQLVAVAGGSEGVLDAALSEARAAGLLSAVDGGRSPRIRFTDEQVREAAYARLAESERARVHAVAGRLLLSDAGLAGGGERVFEALSHLNRAHALIEGEERQRLAELNLGAGRRAAAGGALATAAELFAAGRRFIGADGWRQSYRLALALTEAAARAELARGDPAAAEPLIEEIVAAAGSPLDAVIGDELRIEARLRRGDAQAALEGGLAALGRLGVRLPSQPRTLQIAIECLRADLALRAVRADGLLALGPMGDAAQAAAMRLLGRLLTLAADARPGLAPLLAARQVRIGLDHGRHPALCQGVAAFASHLYGCRPLRRRALELARQAVALARLPDAEAGRAQALCSVSYRVRAWRDDHRGLLDQLIGEGARAEEIGDLAGEAQLARGAVSLAAGMGMPLPELMTLVQRFARAAGRAGMPSAAAELAAVRRYVYELSRVAPRGERARDEAMPERGRRAEGFSQITVELHLAYLFGNYDQALRHLRRARGRPSGLAGTPPLARLHALAALTWLANLPRMRGLARVRGGLEIRRHARRLRALAKEQPGFVALSELVVAERLRIAGRPFAALDAYERAAAAARRAGNLHDLALAEERAGRCCQAQGWRLLARDHLARAAEGWRRYGAEAKRTQLEWEPDRLAEAAADLPQVLDLRALEEAAAAFADERDPARLTTRLMKVILGLAGAARGQLLMRRQEAWTAVVAEGEADDASAAERLRIVQRAARAGQALLLRGAEAAASVSGIQSLLCLPVGESHEPRWALYLESDLAGAGFARERLYELRLLAALLVLAAENARLQDSIEEQALARVRAADQPEPSGADPRLAWRARARLVHSLSARMRAPLTAIAGFAELLQPVPDPAAEAIVRNSRRLRSLLQNVLQLTQLDSPGTGLARGLFSPAQVVEQVRELGAARAREKGLLLAVDLYWPLPAAVPGDPERLRQVLLELCENGLRCTDRGEVRLQVEYDPGRRELRFRVIDTGRGMSPAELKALFQPVLRDGGTGFGLTVARRLSELLGARLSAESTPGVGSGFELVLPLAAVDTLVLVDHQPPSLPVAVADPRPGSALVATDWADNARLLAVYLRRSGTAATCVGSVEGALEAAAARAFDLAVVDAQLPDAPGLAAVRGLRHRGFAGAILVLDGAASADEQGVYLEAGADGCAGTPMDAAEFQAAVSRAMRARAARSD